MSVTAMPQAQFVDGCARGLVELKGREEIVSEVSDFSRSTVKSHAKTIFARFDVHLRAETVAVAQQLGLVADYSISCDRAEHKVGGGAARL